MVYEFKTLITSFYLLVCFAFISCNDNSKDPTSLPQVTTDSITNITKTTAYCGGKIPFNVDSKVIDRGVCWSIKSNPSIADNKTKNGIGIGEFTSFISGLTENKTYYVRAYATNKLGTSYGTEHQFMTATAEDADGNGYHSIKIGTQEWLLENIKTTKYNDGTSIHRNVEYVEWTTSEPAFNWYNNDSKYKEIYGALYNWFAVNTGKLAPKGWHVPTKAEWKVLENYAIANPGYSGTLAKALASDKYWITSTEYLGSIGNDLSKNNSTGFTAISGGLVDLLYQKYNNLNTYGFWWTSSEIDESYAYFMRLSNRFANMENGDGGLNMGTIFNPKLCGMSVRCIKDSI